MKKIILIGTLHMGFTDEAELTQIISTFNPDKILVEIDQEDIDKNSISKYPIEMIKIYEWARAVGIDVAGFDFSLDTTVENLDQDKLDKLIANQTAEIKLHDWKEFNNSQLSSKLLNYEWAEVIDESKFSYRQNKMTENIKSGLVEGNNVVITGTAHLDFFSDQFPQATFPLRNE